MYVYEWVRLVSIEGLRDIDQKRQVLMIRNDEDPFYYSVRGCVKHGESLEEAAAMEVWEETGWKSEVERLTFIHKNFFRGIAGTIEGLNCHELAFYYLMKWEPNCTVNYNSLTLDGLQEHLVCLDIDRLANMDLDVYLEFFSQELKQINFTPKHIITIE